MTRVLVVGAGGRMGQSLVRAIEASQDLLLCAALEHASHPSLGQVVAGDVKLGSDARAACAQADVAVDFSSPASSLALLDVAEARGLPLVIGTTGLDAASEARIAQAALRLAIVRTANFSIGATVLLELVAAAARRLEGYEIDVLEMHHDQKKDAPSGTAIALARAAAEARGQELQHDAVYSRHGITGVRDPKSIGLQALRLGDSIGEHTVYFAGPGERIELSHRALSRENFAAGALRAVRWLVGRPPGSVRDARRASPDVIRIDAVSKRHGEQILFLEASAAVNRGEKIGLVGPNGAGKTTIFRLITREEEPDDGQVSVERGLSIGYFSQDIGELAGKTVLEATLDGAGPVSEAARTLHALEHALGDPTRADELEALVEQFGEAQSSFESLGGYGLEARARTVLAGLGFAASQVDGDVGALSGGWKMRVGLARILVMEPDALLLDEPTNHLDLESILWLEGWLAAFEGAVVMTSHDREFLNRMVGKIVEIESGELITHTGNYDFYERQRALAERGQAAQYARQQAMLAKEEAFIARFKARASHASQVQSRVKKLEKIERVTPPKRRETLEFSFAPSPRSGDDVARLARVSKAYGARVVFDGLDLLIRRGERWCVMGANGAGKSTLLRLVAGALAPDAGNASLGSTVKLGYFAQATMELLSAEESVWQTLENAFPKASIGSLRALAACFGFPGDDVEKRCRLLSGGEKVRLVMARMLFNPPNFLVLDEPTNHLDLATKEMLIRALADFDGTLLMVSHDRHFLSALSNRVLELEPGVPPRIYGSGYADYVVASGHEAPGMRSD